MRAAVYSVGLLGKSQYEGGCLAVYYGNTLCQYKQTNHAESTTTAVSKSSTIHVLPWLTVDVQGEASSGSPNLTAIGTGVGGSQRVITSVISFNCIERHRRVAVGDSPVTRARDDTASHCPGDLVSRREREGLGLGGVTEVNRGYVTFRQTHHW